MTDLELAKQSLKGHTIALCKNETLITSDKRGIAPMMDFLLNGEDLRGYSAADLIVGKAAAMLFVKARVAAVYAETLSWEGKAFLEAGNIPVSYRTLTKNIINRSGTDICPMERAVLACDNAEEGFLLLKNVYLRNSSS